MAGDRTRLGSSSLLLVGIVLAVLIVVNLLSVNRFARIDLTENKEYTLSESTKRMLRGLDDVVNIKVYFSKNLPTYLVTLNQAVRDLLDEYQAYGKENLLVEREDPADDPEVEQRCRVLGIPQVQLQIFEKDKAEVTNAYLGIAVLYEDRSEVIPVVQGVENLEYDLTAAILKAFRKEEKVVGFLVGEGGPNLEKGLASAKGALESQYRTVVVDLARGGPISADVHTLVVASPKNLSDAALYAIDQFVMRGGKLLAFLDPIEIPEGSIQALPKRSGLEGLLENYGIDVGANLVLDARSNANASFSQGFLMFSMPYPFWVRVLPENADPDHPMVNKLSGIVLPWTSTVSAAMDVPEAVLIDTLLRSSEFAWTKTGGYDLNPQQRFQDAPREPTEKLPLALVASGVFPSFFEGKPVPMIDETDGAAAVDSETIPRSAETQVVVVGSANGFLDDMIGQFPANRILFQNAVDWLTLGDDLIAIRSRAAADRPLREFSEKGKALARFLAVFGVPILVVLFGLVRFVRLRNRRAAPLAAEEKLT
jgi:gliding-associated putative ABC transporter substrate-binding component GldG